MKDFGNRVFRLRLLQRKAGVFQFALIRKKRSPVRAENKDLLRNRIDDLARLFLFLPTRSCAPCVRSIFPRAAAR
jgi:hypothetical protein